MSSPAIDIQKIATLSRLKLTPEEAELYQSQLGKVLDYMDVLVGYDLESVEPTAHAVPAQPHLRIDEPRASLDRALALSNAPKSSHDQFQIPKVIE
jgi:aspartyl-tRNA(Asn)/glutamyl-tRNA(Gln) amidotransferase subunit C